ncbi:flavin-containing monooxygenase 5-like isoform X3 [Rana temporaria]|uniref:flavin-containing monooxygenase 5-like isoform X3 n=1 Tax=Rana temporaria TaxID=8407 RepID=UPI001AAC4820|nr:flavin-containing monooxygenase 5-like isoform X3 [Rana temporaria]
MLEENKKMTKRVAVIGAGASGLTAIKCCLDEGLEPTCFEKTDDIGGLWRYKDEPEDGRASIYKSVVINTSKEMMCFSDFPTPEDFPNYMHNSRIMEYFRMYAEKFNLLKYIQNKVFLSTRRGAWVTHRVAKNGYPRDIANVSRFQNLIRKILPSSVTNYMVESALNSRFNHCNFGLLPQHRFSGQHPTVNDELPNRIFSGYVQIRPNVKEFTSTDVIFEDGTVEKNIDAVIFATGYSISFPFCDHSLLRVNNNKVYLYKYMFPYHLEMYTLAVVGLIQPIGAIMPISELQCRLATRVFKGLVKLPDKEAMAFDIGKKKFKMDHRYVPSQRHTIQVDYVEYMDELATLLGVKPDLLRLFATDPSLGFQVLFGPCTPYQFRLMGPGRWSGAKNAIMTQWNRIIKPTKTRTLKNSTQDASFPKMLIVGAIVIILAIFMFYY